MSEFSLAVASTILAGFDRHYRLFRQLSIDAKGSWARGDWNALRDAVSFRIDMYDERVREAVATIRETFPRSR